MAKWDKYLNRPPIHRNPRLERMGSKCEVAERIVTTYLETGRSVRSLATLYGCSKSTIGRYINEYARDLLPYSMYSRARYQAMCNLRGGADDNDDVGSYD